jgi:hypothetical protein
MGKTRENIGKVCIDLGKLLFGSFVLGTILKGEIDRLYILVAGSIAALVAIVLGIIFTSK